MKVKQPEEGTPHIRMSTIRNSQGDKISKAQGCLLGQLAGDALGSLVEFQSLEDIRQAYPKSVRELADGGTWNTIAGQPTDDSEMALMLARMLAEQGRYDADQARQAYAFWLNSGPFDHEGHYERCCHRASHAAVSLCGMSLRRTCATGFSCRRSSVACTRRSA